MNKKTVKLSASTIFQLEAGEHKAVVDGGDLYILVQSVEGASEEAPRGEAIQATPSAGSSRGTVDKPAESTASNKSDEEPYTEDEMMDMETSELSTICKDFGINPDDHDGKNTNKKLRTLILDYQNGKLEVPSASEAKEEAPAPSGRAGRGRQAEVADDTKEEAPAGRAGRSRGASAPKSDEPVEILPEKWDDLKENDMVLVKLDLDDPKEAEKLWEAQIVGWDVPKGMKDEQLYVLFLEDNTEDYLRPEDKLFEYQKQL